MVYNVKDYGAKADGITVDTPAIQKAIDECFSAGGGIVTIPNGKYYIGKIVLKDNITLNLEEGAELIASNDFDNDYCKTPHYEGSIFTYLEKIGEYSPDPRKEGISNIFACGAKNIKITGRGKLNGNFRNILLCNSERSNNPRWANYIMHLEEVYSIDHSSKYFRRPVGIFLEDCKNVIIEDITIKDSSMYACNLRGCKNVNMNNITVDNFIGADNADGFHFSSSEDVRITNCVLWCGDDCIAIDPNDCGTPSRRFMIDNCTFNSRNNCFRIFTSLSPHPARRDRVKGGVVSDIVINNCVVEDASSFIFIHGDEGTVERVSVNNACGRIDLLGTVFLIASHDGAVRDVTMSNFNFVSNGVGYIYTNKEKSISDIRLSNMNITVNPKTKIFGNGFDMPTMSERGYFECGNKPNYWLSHYAPYFLQISNAKNVRLNDITINWGEADIDDIDEVREKAPKMVGYSYPPIWSAEPFWPAVYVKDSENVIGRDVICEGYGGAERITVENSVNVNI